MVDAVLSESSLREKYLADLNKVSGRKGLEVRCFDDSCRTLYILRSRSNYVAKRREGNRLFRKWERLAYVPPNPVEGVWKLVVNKPHEDAIRRIADEMISKGYNMGLVV